MRDERGTFFAALLARCSAYRQTCLTLTAIHPDGKHPTPSRHIPVNNTSALHDVLEQLNAANRQGWGAYFAVGLRRPGLTRWQRGGTADVVALPALFVDVDEPTPDALRRLQSMSPVPSCIVSSGGGYHAYWWLDTPTPDLEMARRLLRGLAAALHGDRLSVAQSLRVPSTVNTKPSRDRAQCSIVSLTDCYFTLRDFAYLLPASPVNVSKRSDYASAYIPNAELLARVTNVLLAHGCKPRGDWLNGACPFPERHKHDDQHPSFGYVESESLSRDQKLADNFLRGALPKSTRDYLAYGAPVGQRNRALFAAACQFRDAGYAVSETESLLVPRYLADSVGHEWRQTREREARQTIQSAYSRSPRPAIGPVSQSRSGR